MIRNDIINHLHCIDAIDDITKGQIYAENCELCPVKWPTSLPPRSFENNKICSFLRKNLYTKSEIEKVKQEMLNLTWPELIIHE